MDSNEQKPEWLEPLLESIAHWRRMATTDVVKEGNESPIGSECALCEKYVDNEPTCHGCPVNFKTGMVRCFGTPYGDARMAWEEANDDKTDDYLLFKQLAMKELEFLESLVPERFRVK